MARKRKSKQKGNNNKPIVAILLFIILGITILKIYSSPHPDISNVAEQVKKAINIPDINTDLFNTSHKQKKKPATQSHEKEYKRLEYAIVKSNARQEIIEHTGYVVSHNSKWKIPNWVGYELTRNRLKGNIPRDDCFAPDPMVKGHKAELSDYKGSGYDRGHMAPAADMKWSKKAMKESFYLSNMCPQNSSLNRGDWNDLEEKVRKWARRDSDIIVICGPIVPKRPQTIGNKVAVPEAFFKVILSLYGKTPAAIGFVMPNKEGNNPLSHYARTVDQVEEITDMDFFSELPDSLEDEIESQYDLKYWDLK